MEPLMEHQVHQKFRNNGRINIVRNQVKFRNFIQTSGIRLYRENSGEEEGIPSLKELIDIFDDIPKGSKIDYRASRNAYKITERDLFDTYMNFKKLDQEIRKRNLDKDEIKLMKFVCEYYYDQGDYWNPFLYGYRSLGGGLWDRTEMHSGDNCKFPGIYLGLIGSQHYATCAGMASALSQIFQYYGINARYTGNAGHAWVTATPRNSKQNLKIDLAEALGGGGFKDTLHKKEHGRIVEDRKPRNIAELKNRIPDLYTYREGPSI